MVSTSVAAAFSRPNGAPMVHVSPNLDLYPPVSTFAVLAFHPLNPGWVRRFDKVIGSMTEGQLRTPWESKAR